MSMGIQNNNIHLQKLENMPLEPSEDRQNTELLLAWEVLAKEIEVTPPLQLKITNPQKEFAEWFSQMQGKLKKIDVLDFRFLELTSLPPQIFELTQLEALLLEGCHLKELPKEIGKLENLKELDLRSNNISELPEEIKNLTKLEEIILAGNPLKNYNKLLQNLKNIKQISFSGGAGIAVERYNLKNEIS